MPSLRNLDLVLWFNTVTEQGLAALTKALTHMSALYTLRLNVRANSLFESDVQALLEQLATLNELRAVTVALTQTRVTEKGVARFRSLELPYALEIL